MAVEKNFTSTVDREKNEPINFGRSETQKIVRSNNPSTKATLFRSRYESKRVTGTGHHAGEVARYRRQGRPRLRWINSIKEATDLRLETLKETVKDRKKWRMLVEEKT
jgi:hypothetical protein